MRTFTVVFVFATGLWLLFAPEVSTEGLRYFTGGLCCLVARLILNEGGSKP